MYPQLDVQLHSAFAPELVHDVLVGRLDLALVAHPGFSPRLTTTKITEAPLHILLAEDDPLATQRRLRLRDLSGKRLIMFDRRAHPSLYETLFDHAHTSNAESRGLHHVMSAEEAGQLIIRGGGVAFMTKTGALRVAHNGLVVRKLDEEDLCLDVHLTARADDRPKLVSEFFRAYVKLLKPVLKPPQMSLPIDIAPQRRA